jgi:hypothetical protein
VPYCPGVFGVAAPGGFHAVFGVGRSHFLLPLVCFKRNEKSKKQAWILSSDSHDQHYGAQWCSKLEHGGNRPPSYIMPSSILSSKTARIIGTNNSSS